MNNRTRRDTIWGIALARRVAIARVAALLLSGVAITSTAATAQSTGLPRADVVEQLGAQYAEKQTAVGITDQGGVIEVFTSDDGSTWTLVVTTPDGTSRVIAAGETWIKR